ncbi:MAG TPA: hypothetical protein VLH84_00675 [Patescibacteria group bacterium]|nr:hypothetical protein [Patescibacteria group bacterium]
MAILFGDPRARAFDRGVELAHSALDRPHMTEALGASAVGALKSVVDHAVLPNIRNGVAEWSQDTVADPEAVAWLPLFADELPWADMIVAPLEAYFLTPHTRVPKQAYSPAYGRFVNLWSMARDEFKQPSGSANTGPDELDPSLDMFGARTSYRRVIYERYPLTGHGRHGARELWQQSTRPVVAYSNGIFRLGAANTAGVLLHESKHVLQQWQTIDDGTGLVFKTPKGQTLGEFQAVQVQGVAAAALQGDNSAFLSRAAQKIAQAWRLHGNVRRPEMVTPAILKHVKPMMDDISWEVLATDIESRGLLAQIGSWVIRRVGVT